MKIKLSKEKLKKELNIEEKNKEKTNKSFFSIFSVVLIILLILGIIIETVFIVTLNNKIDNLEEAVNNIPSIECVYDGDILQEIF